MAKLTQEINYPSNILGVLLSPEVSFSTSIYYMRRLFGGYTWPLLSEPWWSWEWLPHTVHLPWLWALGRRSRVLLPLCCWGPGGLRPLSLQTQEAAVVLGPPSLIHAISRKHAAPGLRGPSRHGGAPSAAVMCFRSFCREPPPHFSPHSRLSSAKPH